MHGMRPFGVLLSKEEALARLLAAALPPERAESVPLAQAAGRVLAEDVRAPFAVPPFARSMMDGYALRAQDAAAPGASLRIVGDVLAGASKLPTVGAGEATRIATGAPLPPGADAVIRVEDTREDAGRVVVAVAVKPRHSVDPAGSDLAEGALVGAAGALLTPARVGLLASIGRAEVRVAARPRVAVASSGDELLAPGARPDPTRIFDSNSTTLHALFAAHGADVARLAHLPDTLAALRAALADAARGSDAIVLTGGASAGAKDLVVDALRAEGEVLFHGVRVKPGKPLLVGRVGTCLVVGLPGNPTSALSNACLFVVPALRKMARLPESSPAERDARLATDVRGEPDRYLFLPVRLEGDQAAPTFKGSGALTSMAESDGWIGVPEGATLRAGTLVSVQAWW